MKVKIETYHLIRVIQLILMLNCESLLSQCKQELCRICNDLSEIKSNYYDSIITSALKHDQVDTWLKCNSIYGGSGMLMVREGGNAEYKELDRKGKVALKMSIDNFYKMEIPQDKYLICYKIFERSGRLKEMYIESELGFRIGKAIKFITQEQGKTFYEKIVVDYELGYKIDYKKVIKICKKKGIDFSKEQLGVKKQIYKADFSKNEMLRQKDSFSKWIVDVMKGKDDMKVWWISIENYKYAWNEFHLLLDAKNGEIIGEKCFEMRADPVSYGHPSPNLKSMRQLIDISQKELKKVIPIPDSRFREGNNSPILPFRDSFDSKVQYTSFSRWNQFEYDSLQNLRRIINFKIKDSSVEVNAEEFIVDSFFKIYSFYDEGHLKSLKLKFYLGFDVLSYQKKGKLWIQEKDTSCFGYDKLIKFCDSMKLWPNGYDFLSTLEIVEINKNTKSNRYNDNFLKFKNRSFWLITRREWFNGRDRVFVIDSKNGQVLDTFFVRLN